VGQCVAKRTVDLRHAPHTVGVLHLGTIGVRLHDLAIGQQSAQVGGTGDLAGMRADGVYPRVERFQRTFRRLDGHGTGDVGDFPQLSGANQRVGKDGRADLRAVDERQPLARLEPIRFQLGPAERLLAVYQSKPALGCAGLGQIRCPFADHEQAHVRQRREVAAGADAALLRDGRHDAAIEHLDEMLDQPDGDTGMSLHQRLDAKRQRQAGDADVQHRAPADGMAAQKVFLKVQDFLRLDPLTRQLAEAGVDAVDRAALGQQLLKATASRIDPLPRRQADTDASNPPGQDGLGLVNRQTVAR